MKKLLTILTILLLLTGCETMYNTPTKQVELFLADYQTLNEDVMDDLDKVVQEEELFNSEQRKRYRELMKKHYQELVYNVKEEEINADKAIVTVEIEVRDYSKVFEQAEKELNDHPEKFQNEKGEYDEEKYLNYRLEQMEKTKDRGKYTMEMNLTKDGKEWELDDLTEEQEDKIHGIYKY